MTEVLGCVIVVLRGGGITPNLVGRKAEQWNNICCDFGGPFNVNLHVGGNGRVPKAVETESVTLVGFVKGTATKRGKAGIMTDGFVKM